MGATPIDPSGSSNAIHPLLASEVARRQSIKAAILESPSASDGVDPWSPSGRVLDTNLGFIDPRFALNPTSPDMLKHTETDSGYITTMQQLKTSFTGLVTWDQPRPKLDPEMIKAHLYYLNHYRSFISELVREQDAVFLRSLGIAPLSV